MTDTFSVAPHRIGLPLLSDQIADLRVFAANPDQRIPWGIPSLDILTEGPAAGEVHMVLGRSHVGKSLLATNVLVNNPDKGMVFFSLEMPARQAVQRLYAHWAKVDHRAVQQMTRNNSLPQHLDQMAEALARHIIIDRGSLTLGDMALYCEAYEGFFGLRPAAVIIDYLELVGGTKASGEGWQRTEAVAGALKDWAKDQEMPVFILHQCTKEEPEYKPPTQNSARGAGFTESDVVIGMWQPWRDPNLGRVEREMIRNEVHFNVIKNRVTGRLTTAPIPMILRDDLRFIDMNAPQNGDFNA